MTKYYNIDNKDHSLLLKKPEYSKRINLMREQVLWIFQFQTGSMR